MKWMTIAAGSIAMIIFSFRKPSVQYLTVAFLLFLSVHMVFIPVDRYAYGMLPFLMLGSAYLIIQIFYLLHSVWTTSLLQRRGI